MTAKVSKCNTAQILRRTLSRIDTSGPNLAQCKALFVEGGATLFIEIAVVTCDWKERSDPATGFAGRVAELLQNFIPRLLQRRYQSTFF